jgi:hypothetical protein
MAAPGVNQQGRYGLGHTETGFLHNHTDAPHNQMGGTLSSAMLWDQIPAVPILST